MAREFIFNKNNIPSPAEREIAIIEKFIKAYENSSCVDHKDCKMYDHEDFGCLHCFRDRYFNQLRDTEKSKSQEIQKRSSTKSKNSSLDSLVDSGLATWPVSPIVKKTK